MDVDEEVVRLINDLCGGSDAGVCHLTVDELRRALGLGVASTKRLHENLLRINRIGEGVTRLAIRPHSLRLLLREELRRASAPSPRHRLGYNPARMRECIAALDQRIDALEVTRALGVLP